MASAGQCGSRWRRSNECVNAHRAIAAAGMVGKAMGIEVNSGSSCCGSCVMLACCVGVAAGQHALAALCWCGQVQRGAAAVGAAAQAASLQRLSGSGGAVPPAFVALRSCGQLRAGAATVGPAAHAVADV